MPRLKTVPKPAPTNLASLIRGLYGRVARQLKVDPSYVSRVARGEPATWHSRRPLATIPTSAPR